MEPLLGEGRARPGLSGGAWRADEENGPSRALQLRLDTAYDYLVENPDTIVIVSGGKGSNEPVSEAQGMYEYLAGRELIRNGSVWKTVREIRLKISGSQRRP